MSDALATRLKEYNSKRYKRSESLKIINEFILSHLLVEVIESLNKVHKVLMCEDDTGIYKLKLLCEKPKKSGFFNMIKRFFSPYEICLTIYKDNHLFICEYYKHSFFEISEKIKAEYESKLKDTFNSPIVIVCKA